MMKKILYSVSSLALLSIPLYVYGQGSSPGNVNISVKINNPLKVTSLSALITAILQNIVMPLAAVIVVLAIVYAGFKYITAQGNPAAIKEANTGLMYVLIGAAILLGAAGISAALQGTLCQIVPGVSCN
jgi:type IV secretory pathway VirB2 component (pilin)